MVKDILIIGAGGHGRSVANVAVSAGYSVQAFVDDAKSGTDVLGFPVISREECQLRYPTGNFALAIGDNAARARVHAELLAVMPDAQFPVLVHASAVIGIGCDIGAGSVVMPLANLGPGSAMGVFGILNSRASLDHDCQLGDFVSVAPGVTGGGDIRIGDFSALSIGAIIKHGVHVGRETVIGAGSYVNQDIGDNLVAYGLPCRVIRQRSHGDGYLA